MQKKDFLQELKEKLSYHNVLEKDEILSYYDELISDQVDLGISEEEVIKKLGKTDDIIKRLGIKPDEVLIHEDEALIKRIQSYTKKSMAKDMKGLFIFLLILSAPFLLVLLSVAFAVLVVILAVLISGIATLFALMVSLPIYGITAIIIGLINVLSPGGIFILGQGIAAIGLSIMLTAPIIRFIPILFTKIKQAILFFKIKVFGGKKND